MATTYDTPGVYIEELTGPSVVVGVTTSTAAFIGPTLHGPMIKPTRVTSLDDYVAQFGGDAADPLRTYLYDASGTPYYLGFGVEGFFVNGGSEAFIVRVGTGKQASLAFKNQAGDESPIFTAVAKQPGANGNGITVKLAAETTDLTLELPTAKITASADADLPDGSKGKAVTVDPPANAALFAVGDIVADDGGELGTVVAIGGAEVLINKAAATPTNGNDLRIADLTPTRQSMRLAPSPATIYPGTVLEITGKNPGGADITGYVVVSRFDNAGYAYLQPAPALSDTISTAQPVTITSQTFVLTVTPPIANPPEEFGGLSANPAHPRYLFNLGVVQSDWITLAAPDQPPAAAQYPGLLPKDASGPLAGGANDDPSQLGTADYEAALRTLANVDGINLVCIPDAVRYGPDTRNAIQMSLYQHCETLKDRFAILDAGVGLDPNAALAQHLQLGTSNYAAFYYPWLLRDDPRRSGPITYSMLVPPSGHMAGLFAGNDSLYGVAHAPANLPVEGVLGLERTISDAQQGPLNRNHVNCLRIFPGQGRVVVWGARTTADPNDTDNLYVNVRRLLIYIEQSIRHSIRWALFQENNPSLWQALKREISDFLTGIWRDGGLFGITPDQAFRVRIDAALNTPTTLALGQLIVEIQVAPVRPAEFIIVRIGQGPAGGFVQETS